MSYHSDKQVITAHTDGRLREKHNCIVMRIDEDSSAYSESFKRVADGHTDRQTDAGNDKTQNWPRVKIQMKFESKYNSFHSRKCIWNYDLQNVGHFVPSLNML